MERLYIGVRLLSSPQFPGNRAVKYGLDLPQPRWRSGGRLARPFPVCSVLGALLRAVPIQR